MSLFAGAQRFPVRAGLTGLLWTRLDTQLTQPDRAHLRNTFPAVAVQAFTGTTEEFWTTWLADEKLDELSGLVLVVDHDHQPVAWVASNLRRFGGRKCFYANSAGVHPAYQGTGLSSTIWRVLLRSAIIRSAPRTLYAVMRTGNPLVYSAWSAATGRTDTTWPTPGGTVPESVRRIAADAADSLGQADRLDPSTLIISDAYDTTQSGLYTERPTSDQTAIDDWFGTILGPRDAVVLVVAFYPLRAMLAESLRPLRRAAARRTGKVVRRAGVDS
ncbi:hypothetical protein E1263_08135 [Kribbella antibiotica]|uniref:N-acetyltransferase domain-containing protein n=1 Tax=Kribbella antibiotica TaxID=190195 RepID=A0A4R4ZT32_9ACTN|nr:GNAT family N-acetyltransferase [Kribbella antibiotica]TDD61149.1 hypothetical protein E1263_08135 [Kribbella antibiotica]